MIIRLALLSIIFVVLISFLKEQKAEIAVIATVAASVFLLWYICDLLVQVIYTIMQIVDKAGIDKDIIVLLFRIVGTGYVCEFASNICEDFGSKSLGDKISLAGKVAILVLTLPILTKLIDLIFSII